MPQAVEQEANVLGQRQEDRCAGPSMTRWMLWAMEEEVDTSVEEKADALVHGGEGRHPGLGRTRWMHWSVEEEVDALGGGRGGGCAGPGTRR